VIGARIGRAGCTPRMPGSSSVWMDRANSTHAKQAPRAHSITARATLARPMMEPVFDPAGQRPHRCHKQASLQPPAAGTRCACALELAAPVRRLWCAAKSHPAVVPGIIPRPRLRNVHACFNARYSSSASVPNLPVCSTRTLPVAPLACTHGVCDFGTAPRTTVARPFVGFRGRPPSVATSGDSCTSTRKHLCIAVSHRQS
jgi:hypothetical protein